jgi:ethanolamine utilization protein EutA
MAEHKHDQHSHSHEGSHGHSHDHDELQGVNLGNLTSVGIDIGSSTSHLMFSRMRIGYPSLHTRRPEVLERSVLSRSTVLLTPFTKDWTIETQPLQDLIKKAFDQADLKPSEVDTGAVIITGEAARRSNARAIVDMFSDESGRFVCATAGPRLEMLLAAHGSGAVLMSRERGLTLLNIDVGGGTTKIGLIKNGRLVDGGVFNIGARVIAYEDGVLKRLEETGRYFLQQVGKPHRVGEAIDTGICELVSKKMSDVLFQILGGEGPADELVVSPFVGSPQLAGIDGVVFSGGVSEYIYGREQTNYGDLGPYLGLQIKERAERIGLRILDGTEGLRATVIGASQYSLQLSGETIHIPDPSVLPFRNLRVVVVSVEWGKAVSEKAERVILNTIQGMDPVVKGEPFALAVLSPPFIGYGTALELAKGLRGALESVDPENRPRALVFDQNIGRVVGESLGDDLKILSIDEISLSELDFIDIGSPTGPDSYVPVVVKSLVFEG